MREISHKSLNDDIAFYVIDIYDQFINSPIQEDTADTQEEMCMDMLWGSDDAIILGNFVTIRLICANKRDAQLKGKGINVEHGIYADGDVGLTF